MPLTTPTPPKRLLQLVSDAVRELMDEPGTRAAENTDETTEIAFPHEVFVLGLDEIVKKDLTIARKIGWRCLIIRDGKPHAAAEVSVSQGSPKMQFSHLNMGPFVEQTARALDVAESLAPVAKNPYVVRLLTIPALYVVALWLHGDEGDMLIPMAPTSERLIPNKQCSPADFFKRLLPSAEARLAFDDSPKP